MSTQTPKDTPRWLTGGAWGPVLAISFVAVTTLFLVGLYVTPAWDRDYGYDSPFEHALFGPAIEQPIPFSHRLHVSDKQIECQYCHSYTERSLNAGLPTVAKCLGCHDHIIPEHEEIRKLRGYRDRGQELPWVRVYYNPDHVFFPHYRHIGKGVECQECHSNVERVDRLRQVTFYMGFCLDCHRERGASTECVTCHQ